MSWWPSRVQSRSGAHQGAQPGLPASAWPIVQHGFAHQSATAPWCGCSGRQACGSWRGCPASRTGRLDEAKPEVTCGIPLSNSSFGRWSRTLAVSAHTHAHYTFALFVFLPYHHEIASIHGHVIVGSASRTRNKPRSLCLVRKSLGERVYHRRNIGGRRWPDASR